MKENGRVIGVRYKEKDSNEIKVITESYGIKLNFKFERCILLLYRYGKKLM